MTPENAVVVDSSLIGQFLDDRYRLDAVIGVGGLGSVYRATHLKLQRSVAVKLLHEELGTSELQRGRFAREATALAALEHPNIVSVLDYGVSVERPYLVMELLEGETLSRRLQRARMQTESALWITRQLLAALAFVHRSGLVHRDLKPSNVFLQRLKSGFERVKLLDFGLAKFTAPVLAGAEATLTRDGTIVGTPAYMSPEQASGDVVDARGDVYAVGVILYRMLSGRLPFEGDATDQLRGHLVAPVPALELLNAAADPALEALIQRSMAKARSERFEDAADMLRSLLELAPKYQADTGPVRVWSDLMSEDVATSDWLMHLDDSNEIPTRPRPGTREGPRHHLSRRVRRVVRLGARVISTTSVLLVGAALALLTYLLQDDADRAELAAIHRRVSARVVERAALDASGATSTETRTDLRAASAPDPRPALDDANLPPLADRALRAASQSQPAAAPQTRSAASAALDSEGPSSVPQSSRSPGLAEAPALGLGARGERAVAQPSRTPELSEASALGHGARGERAVSQPSRTPELSEASAVGHGARGERAAAQPSRTPELSEAPVLGLGARGERAVAQPSRTPELSEARGERAVAQPSRAPELSLSEASALGLGARLELGVVGDTRLYSPEYTSGLGPLRPSEDVGPGVASAAATLAANSGERREPRTSATGDHAVRDAPPRAELVAARTPGAASAPRAVPATRPAAPPAESSLEPQPRRSALDAAPARASAPALAPVVWAPPKPSALALGAKLDVPIEAASSAATDPWAEPVPPQLRAARRAVQNASRGHEPMILALRAYNREHGADPRGHLLLAELYMNRLWRGDALSQYSFALADHPSARNAPEVLPGLIKLVIHGEFARPAERLIAHTYGAAAIPVLDRALAQLAHDDRAHARLRALRVRLTSTDL